MRILIKIERVRFMADITYVDIGVKTQVNVLEKVSLFETIVCTFLLHHTLVGVCEAIFWVSDVVDV